MIIPIKFNEINRKKIQKNRKKIGKKSEKNPKKNPKKINEIRWDEITSDLIGVDLEMSDLNIELEDDPPEFGHIVQIHLRLVERLQQVLHARLGALQQLSRGIVGLHEQQHLLAALQDAENGVLHVIQRLVVVLQQRLGARYVAHDVGRRRAPAALARARLSVAQFLRPAFHLRRNLNRQFKVPISSTISSANSSAIIVISSIFLDAINE